MTDKEWREQLKVGDDVLIPLRHSNNYAPGKVVRVTRTQIVIQGNGRESRHNKDNGWERGGGYNTRWFYPVTPERLEAAKVYQLGQEAERMLEKVKLPADRAGLEAFKAAIAPYVQ